MKKLANVSGIILAAGKSTRMGEDKRLLPFRGLMLLQHIINASVHSELKEIILVVDDNFALDSFNLARAKVAVSYQRDKGQSYSLNAGLSAISEKNTQGCMVLLADQPLINTELINMLVQKFSEDTESFLAPVKDCVGGNNAVRGNDGVQENNTVRGNPVIIPSTYFEQIKELKEDYGAKNILKNPQTPLKLVSVDEIAYFLDVDTKEAYTYLCKQYDKLIS